MDILRNYWQSAVTVCAFLLLFCVLGTHFVHTVQAQDFSVAQPLAIAGEPAEGSIISYDGVTYGMSSSAYDSAMMGVVTSKATIELRSLDGFPPGTYPVVTSGVVYVRVSADNGPIKATDTITTYSNPGVGMKATKSGFILGVAQADFEGPGEGMIPVLLDIKFAFAKESPMAEKIRVQLSDLLKLSGLSIIDDPIMSLRYLLAGCVIIASLVVTFLTVGKVARGGVDAIGRNPLASRAITFSIIMNTILSIAIVGMGLAAAYFISTV